MTRFTLIASLFVLSCNASESSGKISTVSVADTTTDDTDMATTPIPLNGCYTYAINKDTATMKLVTTADGVTGTLVYNPVEKDDNRGTIKGKRKDNLIIAHYTFESEGVQSVREVVFKINGETLTEGFGDIYTSGDTAKFKSLAQLQFQNEHAFKKVDCPE